MTSSAELLLAVQLEQAGIPFEREFRFHPDRKWRADFRIDWSLIDKHWSPVLIEIDGGAFVGGRHSRGTGVEKDAEKQSAAAILGYRVIRCTPAQVDDGRALAWIRLLTMFSTEMIRHDARVSVQQAFTRAEIEALVLTPLAMLGSSGLFLVVPLLWSGSLLSISDNALSYSVNQSAREALYLEGSWRL